MESAKVPVKLVKVTRVLGRTGTPILPLALSPRFPSPFRCAERHPIDHNMEDCLAN